jgi:hypothetical protein
MGHVIVVGDTHCRFDRLFVVGHAALLLATAASITATRVSSSAGLIR